MRFGMLWQQYLDSIDKANGSAHYVKQEQIGRLWLLPKLKNKYVSKISLADMQKCVNAPYEEKDLSKKTCENVRGALTAVYRFAYKQRTPLERPEFLTIPKGAKTKPKKILQPDTLKTLFKEDWILHYRKKKTAFYIHAFRFLVLSGLRRGEAAGIRMQDIQGNILHIQQAYNSLDEETPGKNENAPRYLVLSARMLQVIADQKTHLKKQGIISPWLFPTRNGEPDANAIYKGWLTYRDQREWDSDISIQSMRRTMVSVVKPYLSEALLKQIVGHSESMDTFGVYGEVVDGELEYASKLIADTFDRLLE